MTVEAKHYHNFVSIGGGRMGMDTPAGYIEVSDYPYGDAVCSCGDSPCKPWSVRAIEAGQKTGMKLDSVETWLAFVVGYFAGVKES